MKQYMHRWQARIYGWLLVCLLLVGCSVFGIPRRGDPAEMIDPTAMALTYTAIPTRASPTAVAPTNTPMPAATSAIQFEKLTMHDGTMIEYAIAQPPGFDPAQRYPVLLAMPPGGQDKQVTETLMKEYWAAEGAKRGWIVLSPVAPKGQLYFDGSEAYIPEFLEATAQRYQPEGGKYFLAGVSNGGLSAFRIILNTPERFRAMIVLPGFPYSADDKKRLGELKQIPVAFWVGAEDSGWREEAQATYQKLLDQGGVAVLTIVPNESHIIRSLTGSQLFDQLERFRSGS